jgi:hypothetical protein
VAPLHPAQRRLLQVRGRALSATVRQHPRRDLSRLAAASLLAAAAATIAQIAEPFDHGPWLISYLLLVGALGPYLLGRGQAALLELADRPPVPRGARRVQLMLWAIGVIAVPVGVLADARLAVVVGSLSLLVSLASLWASVRAVATPHALARGWRATAYIGLVGFLATSAVVGTALAWDIQWL